MRSTIAAVLMALHMHVLAETVPVVSPDWAAEAAPRISEQAIREAVRATLAEETASASRERGSAFRTRAVEQFSRDLDEARVPGCLRPDGLKHFQPRIGPVQLAGIFVLPFLIGAPLLGNCR